MPFQVEVLKSRPKNVGSKQFKNGFKRLQTNQLKKLEGSARSWLAIVFLREGTS